MVGVSVYCGCEMIPSSYPTKCFMHLVSNYQTIKSKQMWQVKVIYRNKAVLRVCFPCLS